MHRLNPVGAHLIKKVRSQAERWLWRKRETKKRVALVSIGCDERTRAPQISIHTAYKGKSIRTMGRTREWQAAAAKRLKLTLFHSHPLLPTTRLAFFLSLSTTRSAAWGERRGRQRGRRPPPTHPPCVVACTHTRRSADGMDAPDQRLFDAIPLTSQSQPLVDRCCFGGGTSTATLPRLGCGGGGTAGGRRSGARRPRGTSDGGHLGADPAPPLSLGSALDGQDATKRVEWVSEPLAASRCSIGVGRPHRWMRAPSATLYRWRAPRNQIWLCRVFGPQRKLEVLKSDLWDVLWCT